MQDTDLVFGTAVSLHAKIDRNDFCLSSSGDANRQLQLQRSDINDRVFLGFDRCVFYLGTDNAASPNVGGQILLGSTVTCRHMFSSLMIATSRREPSTLDGTCCAVSLQDVEECGPMSRFTVLPRYKLQRTGDHLHDLDDVIFKLESTELYLNITVVSGNMEVNCSDSPFGWSIRRYCAPTHSIGKHTPLSFGLPFALRHSERDCFLTLGFDAGDSFVMPDEEPLGTPMVSKSNELLSSSMWVMEKENPCVGGPLTTNCKIRLRHAATNTYLIAKSVSTTRAKYILETISLPEARDDKELQQLTLFVFTLITANALGEDPTIKPLHTHLLLKHVKSNQSVRVLSSDELALVRVHCLQDALSLSPLPIQKQQSFCLLLSHIEQIRIYCNHILLIPKGHGIQYLGKSFTKEIVRIMQSTLSKLIMLCSNSKDSDPLTREGLPIHENQKALSDMNLHTLLYTALTCPFSQPGDDKPMMGGAFAVEQLNLPEASEIHKVCRLCYRLLKQMCKGYAEFATKLHKLIDFMQDQEGYRLHVADTLLEMFSNSTEISFSIVIKMTKHFVTLLATKGRSSGYLKFLSKLCVLRGRGVASHQEIVTKALEANHSILIEMKPDDGQLMLFVPAARTKVEGWISLPDFLRLGEPKLVKFFETQLELFLAISTDGKPASHMFVEKFLTRDCIVCVLKLYSSSDLTSQMAQSQQIFSLTMRTCMELYIKRDLHYVKHEPVNMLLMCGAVVPSHKPITIGLAERAFVDIIKECCSSFLSATEKQKLDDPDHNLCLTTCVEMWYILLKSRVYKQEEVKTLLQNILRLCDPRTDETSTIRGQDDTVDPWVLTAESQALFETKSAICRILRLILEHAVQDSSTVLLSRTFAVEEDEIRKQLDQDMANYYELVCSEQVLPLMPLLAQAQSVTLTNEALHFAVDHSRFRKLVYDKIKHVRSIGTQQYKPVLQQKYTCAGAIAQELSMSLCRVDQLDIPMATAAFEKLLKLLSEKSIQSQEEGEGVPQIIVEKRNPWSVLRTLINTAAFSTSLHQPKEDLRAPKYVEETNTIVHHWNIIPFFNTVLATQPLTSPLSILCLKCIRLLCQTKMCAEACQRYAEYCISGIIMPGDDEESQTIQYTCLRILVSIVAATQEQQIDKSIVRRFVESIDRAPQDDELIIGALQRIVFSPCPSLHNQRTVLSTLIESQKLKHVANPTKEMVLSNFAMTRNSALVRLVLKCCLGNSVTQSMAQKVLPTSTIFNLLLRKEDPLPLVHQIAYMVFLGVVHFTYDETATKVDMKQQQRVWTIHPLWWDMVVSNFPVIAQKKTSSAIMLLTDGLLPTIQLYFNNMFSVSYLSRDKVLLGRMQELLRLMEIRAKQTRNAGPLKHQLIATINVMKVHARLMRLDILSDAPDYFGTGSDDSDVEPSSPKTKSPRRLKSGRFNKDVLGTLIEAVKDAAKPCAKDFEMFIRALQKNAAPTFLSKLLHHWKMREIPIHIVEGLLQAMRFDMEEDNEDDTEDGDEEEAQKKSEELKHKQIVYTDKGAVVLVMTMFDDDLDGHWDGLITESTKLGIALLEGGNLYVQKKLYDYLRTTQETFFQKVERRITRAREESRQLEHTRRLVSLYKISNVVARPSFAFVKEIFRFLQLMCEGHNSDLQNYIRHQPDNVFSVNTLTVLLQFLEELVRTQDITDTVVSLLEQTFNLLTELCQGPCHQNQLMLVQNNLCLLISNVLTGKEFTDSLNLREATIVTLLSLLEGCNDHYIPSHMLQQVSVDVLSSLLDEAGSSEEYMEFTYNIAILILQLNTFLRYISNPQTAESLRTVVSKFDSIVSRIGRIEIQRGDQLEAVFFRIPDICFSLSEMAKSSLVWSLDRSTQGTKHSDFLNKSDNLIFDMEHTHAVATKLEKYMRPSLVNLSMKTSLIENIVITVAFILNVLLVGYPEMTTTITSLAVLQTYMTFHLLAFYCALSIPAQLYSEVKKRVTHTSKLKKVQLCVLQSDLWLKTFMFGGALCGLTISPEFLAVHLLMITSKSTVLQNVTTAITMNAMSLVLTAVLGMVTAYLFSIIGFVFFQDDFITEDRPNGACNSLFQCFVFIVTTGIRNGGGVGDVLKIVERGQDQYGGRIVYDFFFWVVMIIIFLNILFGIILDTFAELRDDRNKKEEDIRNVCFVCGLEASELEQRGIRFFVHCSKDHDMWHYLYFMHHLNRKPTDDYTGQETFVSQKLKTRDASFFPRNRCLALDALKLIPTEDMSPEDAKFQNLTEIVSEVHKKLQEMSDSAPSEMLHAGIQQLTTKVESMTTEMQNTMRGTYPQPQQQASSILEQNSAASLLFDALAKEKSTSGVFATTLGAGSTDYKLLEIQTNMTSSPGHGSASPRHEVTSPITSPRQDITSPTSATFSPGLNRRENTLAFKDLIESEGREMGVQTVSELAPRMSRSPLRQRTVDASTQASIPTATPTPEPPVQFKTLPPPPVPPPVQTSHASLQTNLTITEMNNLEKMYESHVQLLQERLEAEMDFCKNNHRSKVETEDKNIATDTITTTTTVVSQKPEENNVGIMMMIPAGLMIQRVARGFSIRQRCGMKLCLLKSFSPRMTNVLASDSPPIMSSNAGSAQYYHNRPTTSISDMISPPPPPPLSFRTSSAGVSPGLLTSWGAGGGGDPTTTSLLSPSASTSYTPPSTYSVLRKQKWS